MANRGHRILNNLSRAVGQMPTTGGTLGSEDVAMMVVAQNRSHSRILQENHRSASLLNQQSQDGGSQQYITLHYAITLHSKSTNEIWRCDISSTTKPNEVNVNNGAYKIVLNICPQRDTQISIGTMDLGHEIPPNVCKFTILLPASGFCPIYHVTFHLLRHENSDHSVLCDEIYLGIQTIPPGLDLFRFQEGSLSDIEHPLPKIKLKGMLGCSDGWRILTHFESLADNGEFSRYVRHRRLLEERTRNRPHYKDLVAMVLLEEGVANLIQTRLTEGVKLAKRACKLSSLYSCVNDRAILGYAYAVYAAAARFGGDLDGARAYLNSALEIFEPMEPSAYTAITLYNIGAIIMEKSATVGVSEVEEEEAEKSLRLAEQHWMHQKLNTTFRIMPRIYNRLISLYLKCSPNTEPDLTVVVSTQGLIRAAEKIRNVEQHLLPYCTRWLLTTFFLAKTDMCIRSGDLHEGARAVQDSLEIASQSGLQREVQGARRRLTLLHKLRQSGDPADML